MSSKAYANNSKCLSKWISVRANVKNENVRSETASDPRHHIGYKTTGNDLILMK